MKYVSILFLAFLGIVFGAIRPEVPNIQRIDSASSSRIVGGSSAAVGQLPYQVRLGSNAGLLCGGSLISANYVLTAGHCVNGGVASNYYIRAGSLQRNSGGVVVGVSEIKVHPNYSGLNYDYALLKLASPLSFSNVISAIPLESGEVPSGAPVIISGWGGLYNDGPLANDLQFNTLKALNTKECERRIGSRPQGTMCLDHKKGNGACGGDSGGPAAYNGKLVGVCSFGINGCGSNFPDGYANVSFVNAWIRQNAGL